MNSKPFFSETPIRRSSFAHSLSKIKPPSRRTMTPASASASSVLVADIGGLPVELRSAPPVSHDEAATDQAGTSLDLGMPFFAATVQWFQAHWRRCGASQPTGTNQRGRSRSPSRATPHCPLDLFYDGMQTITEQHRRPPTLRDAATFGLANRWTAEVLTEVLANWQSLGALHWAHDGVICFSEEWHRPPVLRSRALVERPTSGSGR